MAFTLTTNHGQNGGGPSFSIGTAQNIGDLMIVGMFNFNGNGLTITGATDTVGTSYSFFTWSGGGNTYGLVYGFLAGTGANTLAVTWSSGSANGVAYSEFTGSSVSGATVDGTPQGATGSGATAATTPSDTTVGADDLVINYINANNGTVTFASPWTTAVSAANGMAYQADVAAGTYAPNATFVSSTFGSGVIAFKAGTSGSVSPSTFSVSDPSAFRIPGIH